MKHYKLKKTGEIFGFESDGSQDHLIKKGMVLLTEKELEDLFNPKSTKEELGMLEKAWRDSELLHADVQILKIQDGAAGSEKEWRAYRVSLRNWPESLSFPDATKRPAAPSTEV